MKQYRKMESIKLSGVGRTAYVMKVRDKEMKTYGDIYNEFCDKFPNVEVEDYRPADPMYIPQLLRGIPYAILVWLKDGSKVVYVSESEDKE